MIPGTICEDITLGKKLFVVLNDGSAGYYIVIKTTSQQKYKGITYGCQHQDRLPHFFLPKGSCCLHKDTWAMLDEFFELKQDELLARHFSGQIRRIGVLPEDIVKEMLYCAANCDDVTTAQAIVIKQMLDVLDEK